MAVHSGSPCRCRKSPSDGRLPWDSVWNVFRRKHFVERLVWVPGHGSLVEDRQPVTSDREPKAGVMTSDPFRPSYNVGHPQMPPPFFLLNIPEICMLGSMVVQRVPP